MVSKFKLPDSVIESTRQLYLQGEGHQWALADHLVGVVDELRDHYASMMGDEDGRIAARKARTWIIRSLAVGIGVDESTLRDREVMGRFFPTEVRQPYTDTLTYHQLRACKSANDKWQAYADWAMDNLPAPVSVIRAKIKGNGHDDPPYWQRKLDKIIHDIEKLMEDTPEEVKGILHDALVLLSTVS